ncbi:MAG: vitamin B12-dependent ribonucleotide reductase [Chloroflexi bacterium]|nr:MAG: vitamin B12-dependent ribonucleotide reductase [Chloroflexota bacterium]TMD72988.1 MAG: vitamin B12-dependent ribonucleotide reductase [Chloroflexota bacterium]
MAKNLADLTGPRAKHSNGNGHSKTKGLRFGRYFTPPGSHAYDLIEWERRTAGITGEKGQVIFEQKDVEVPRQWSQLAINVVAQKYFRGSPGSPERETSVRQIIDRVVDTLAKWGREGGYFATEEDVENWAEELRFLLVTQHASFNSPVWFNIGVPGRQQQASACFINAVQDSMESILDLVKTEGMLFKFGSGTGTNLSVLRSSKEQLSGGGTASGPVSFMRGYDSFAGSIKSGGTTRRAAKMVILNADHPDVLDFIRCKAEEEKKAWALIEAGYNVGFNVAGGAYDSVQFQNANHSVRIGDDFMRAVIDDKEWKTKAVVDGRTVDTYKARDMWREIADAAWICGDPGLQFDSTIQDWNVVPNTGRINATNPCSEFVFLDDTACNLLSLNLMKFQSDQGTFDVERFERAVDVCFTGQEILVSNASYPTPAIGRNSEALRPLGLGYANIGALLMSMGLAYDSDEGRRFAGAITSIMTGRAFAQSARMAQVKGPFTEYAKNREPMLRVMEKHRAAASELTTSPESNEVVTAARETWEETVKLGRAHGYRNAQATVLAPTGTIGLMMDCDTTGIEPDLALVKYKKLVGGGLLKIVNTTVPAALRKLGYDEVKVKEIVEYIDENDTIEGAPHLQDEHLKVFDCAFKPVKGARSIAPMGHVRMMAAVQPFISGSMSKTVNLPTDATVEDIQQTYMESWKLGLKCIAIYRDGCKRSQPLSTSLDKEKTGKAGAVAAAPAEVEYRVVRRKLPDERKAVTHKFDIGGHEGYLTVGLYEDGMPGELFVTMAKEGSTISGLMDAFATQTSYALQFGVPLRFMVDKFSHMRFEPAGFTKNKEIPIAKSIVDYIFRWMASHFLPVEDQDEVGIIRREDAPASAPASKPAEPEFKVIAAPAPKPISGAGTQKIAFVNTDDAPACSDCGSITVRSGSCYKCLNCGATTGCS